MIRWTNYCKLHAPWQLLMINHQLIIRLAITLLLVIFRFCRHSHDQYLKELAFNSSKVLFLAIYILCMLLARGAPRLSNGNAGASWPFELQFSSQRYGTRQKPDDDGNPAELSLPGASWGRFWSLWWDSFLARNWHGKIDLRGGHRHWTGEVAFSLQSLGLLSGFSQLSSTINLSINSSNIPRES